MTREFDIRPLTRAGPIVLGALRSEVRAALSGAKVSGFKKGADPIPADSFDDLGVFVYYNADDRCEAAEFASPAKIILGGIDLLAVPYSTAKSKAEALGGSGIEDDDGFMTKSLGISLYCPGLKHGPNARVESVLVFIRGYFD